ncbi:MAG: hypothetical protein ACD_77C00415G0011 [uncultured bacterium]|nr:MAG: hypothetical protein ACD_77C00415G0011 [uncultured bacterium]
MSTFSKFLHLDVPKSVILYPLLVLMRFKFLKISETKASELETTTTEFSLDELKFETSAEYTFRPFKRL